MKLNYNTISKLLKNNDAILNKFLSIVKNIKGSVLITEIAKLLDDDNIYLLKITDKNKLGLVNLVIKYYDSCGHLFITDNNIEKLVKIAKSDIYSIQTASGVRIATTYEVENGVRGLIVEHKYILGEDKYKLICLLYWTITGKLSYFKQAGFNYNYDKINGLLDSLYDMIVRSASSLKQLIDWMSSEEFKDDIQKLNKAIKIGDYKYPKYAHDEVKADITIKQLIFYLDKNIPRKSDDKRHREIIHNIIRYKENKYFKISPLDISIMRGLYQELTCINSRISKPTVIEEDNKLKNECEELIQGKNDKLISADLFVFKIITTLEKINYKSCSKKQYDIILEALTKLRKEKKSIENKKEIEHTKIISDIDAEIYGDSLLDMSNALGDGDIL